MRRLKRLIGEERGSASLEFIGAGMLLLVPLVYLIIALAQIQSHSFGVDAAARYATRVLAQSPDAVDLVASNVAVIAQQYGLSPEALQVAISCIEPGPCPVPGGLVTVTVTAHSPLPLMPDFLTVDGGASVTVSASSTHRVSDYEVSP
ncbi:TadE/TadG family type IV pilus assembly protein [Microbacterium sp. YY-03]|uniref:TadE/TadG family type IV pilus assembly protein n=1 Tax=Microbacterium sp. YY-03 TaxID=3421636 RepID=UPI003D166411